MVPQAPVLIVDGNTQMTTLLQRFLARQQIATQAVSHPADARAVLAQQPFGVVLTDYFRPSGDGLALLRYLCQVVPGTPGILMTAFSAPALWRQALAEGAYACIDKPFRLQELWAIVQPALQGLPAPVASDPITKRTRITAWGVRSSIMRARAEGKVRDVGPAGVP